MGRFERFRSGRPDAGEYPGYTQPDLDLVQGDDAVLVLQDCERRVIELLSPLGEEETASLRYAPEKWTLKEVIGHLADDERIYAYRALCLARGESVALPGFDENLYVAAADFESRSLASLIREYKVVRSASVYLFNYLPREAWLRRGVVNEFEFTVRGLAFHIAGHELHHLKVIQERYLPLIETPSSG